MYFHASRYRSARRGALVLPAAALAVFLLLPGCGAVSKVSHKVSDKVGGWMPWSDKDKEAPAEETKAKAKPEGEQPPPPAAEAREEQALGPDGLPPLPPAPKGFPTALSKPRSADEGIMLGRVRMSIPSGSSAGEYDEGVVLNFMTDDGELYSVETAAGGYLAAAPVPLRPARLIEIILGSLSITRREQTEFFAPAAGHGRVFVFNLEMNPEVRFDNDPGNLIYYRYFLEYFPDDEWWGEFLARRLRREIKNLPAERTALYEKWLDERGY